MPSMRHIPASSPPAPYCEKSRVQTSLPVWRSQARTSGFWSAGNAESALVLEEPRLGRVASAGELVDHEVLPNDGRQLPVPTRRAGERGLPEELAGRRVEAAEPALLEAGLRAPAAALGSRAATCRKRGRRGSSGATGAGRSLARRRRPGPRRCACTCARRRRRKSASRTLRSGGPNGASAAA